MLRHARHLSMLLLAATAGCSAPASNAPPAAAAHDGARIYEGICAACHQHDARGVAGVYPSLVGSPVLLGDTGELARWVIQSRRPPTLPVGKYSTVMARFGWLKAEDAAALFTYLRTHFGNHALPVDAAAVARALDAAP